MSLDNLYKLRNDFTLIGLTGRMGGGCNDIAKKLSSNTNPFLDISIPDHININEKQKFRICKDFLTDKNYEWATFKLLKYKDILLLFFLSELISNIKNNDCFELTLENLLNVFKSLYDENVIKTPRIGQEDKTNNIIENTIFPFFLENSELLNQFKDIFKLRDSKINIDNVDNQCGDEMVDAVNFNNLFFGKYSDFCKNLYKIIDSKDPFARQLFLQDLACNVRSTGTIKIVNDIDQKNIYAVAKIIKNIIKINKKAEGKVKLIIDSLKNSLEINFFKERYSGFYLVSSNRDMDEAKEYLIKKVRDSLYPKIKKIDTEQTKVIQNVVEDLIDLDQTHYKIGEFKKGNFTSPDLENCIQKADYYIFNTSKINVSENLYFSYYTLDMQLLKLIALIQKPGIITPNALERNMQLAFSSKYNSGCISRQVGAVITDNSYVVKSIGWNEVSQGQTPCSLRNITDLVFNENSDVFTDYEKNGGDYDGSTFREKTIEVIENVSSVETFKDNLEGHNCPFCFKEFHNNFEGKDNQVHTRSLHAEENAMLQISKYGGQPLKGGNLFTTASPCELCSKKAYQLGIKNIFYIDPYPGIAQSQILKGGSQNPDLFMFQGAVGRGFFKLFEPYMSIKDETKVRFGLKPIVSQKNTAKQLKDLLSESIEKSKDKNLMNYLDSLENDSDIMAKVIELMKNGLDNKN